MHALLFFFLSALITYSSQPNNNNALFVEAKTSRISFTVDLIHRDSPMSPFYNSSMTKSEHLRNAAFRSISRHNQFNKPHLNDYSQISPPPESIVIPNGGDYLMRFYMGTPPIERLAIADTGSDLIWVQCYPCQGSNCFPQDTPLFDPSKSSTFSLVSCDSQACNLLLRNRCGISNVCRYLYTYGDKSYTIGDLATESINFGPTSGNNAQSTKSIFGCGHQNVFTSLGSYKTTGLVGLGAGPLSLVSQLGDEIGHKFSYCLVPPSSTFNSKLRFGDAAIIGPVNGVSSTPLIIKSNSPTYYYLNLEGISVGQIMVNSDQSGGGGGNIIIDSGTTFTYLEQNFYNNFVDSLKKALGVEPVQNHPQPFDFCFGYNNDINFPEFVFHFTGASVTLNTNNLFDFFTNNEHDLLCLLVISTSSSGGGLSIFGNRAQINFLVEYDLEGKKVSFAPTDCTKN